MNEATIKPRELRLAFTEEKRGRVYYRHPETGGVYLFEEVYERGKFQMYGCGIEREPHAKVCHLNFALQDLPSGTGSFAEDFRRWWRGEKEAREAAQLGEKVKAEQRMPAPPKPPAPEPGMLTDEQHARILAAYLSQITPNDMAGIVAALDRCSKSINDSARGVILAQAELVSTVRAAVYGMREADRHGLSMILAGVMRA